jgi:hypothetical protein
MSKLYPARVRVAVEDAPHPALLRSWTESPPAAQHLRRGSMSEGSMSRGVTRLGRSPWYGPIRHWFFPIGCRSRCRGAEGNP